MSRTFLDESLVPWLCAPESSPTRKFFLPDESLATMLSKSVLLLVASNTRPVRLLFIGDTMIIIWIHGTKSAEIDPTLGKK